jgi:hypothetical protein
MLVAANVFGLMVLAIHPARGRSQWVEQSWSDFCDGSFTDAGYSTDRAIQLKVPAPFGIAVADFDRAQYPDIAVASSQSAGGVAWTDSLLFFGDGKEFSTRQLLALPTVGASGVAAGHLNGDGYPELVFSNRCVLNYHSLLSYVYWNDRGLFPASGRRDEGRAGNGDVDRSPRRAVLVH